MSAYMIEREHITYLVGAAMFDGGHAWYHVKPPGMRHRRELDRADYDRAAEVGQMLWDENKRSINARYPDTIDNMDDAPGVVGETYRFHKYYGSPFTIIEPVQLIKAVNCFMYQACETDDWPESEAFAFCQSLISKYICKLPGYDAAEWGAPSEAVQS